MRYAILSDIHGNREALDTVLEKVEQLAVEKVVCLGDIVGYGADPAYCVERIREVSQHVVAGNHDHAALGKISIDYFNQHARAATIWTREHLEKRHTDWLDKLPLVVVDGECTFVHGSLDAPALFDYIQTSYDAFLSMEEMTTKACFIGHSHVPIAFLLNEVITYTLEPKIELTSCTKAIVNVGSVGQPRDNNPEAAFGVFDDETELVEIHRIPYDVDRAAARIVEAGLPEFLAQRLKVGR